MKCFVVLFVAVCFTACFNALPVDDDTRYMWIPDEQGVMHFVDLQDDTPATRAFVPEDDIVFLLYTRKNPSEGQVIRKGDLDGILASNFNTTNPVKLTIHGWIADYTSGTNTKIRDAFLNAMDVNMIAVDWSLGAFEGYLASCNNVLAGAPIVGGFIDWLSTIGVSFSNIHVIGHSLGGQFAGNAARACKLGVVEYVTGLDPAYPTWSESGDRIRKTDGKYVEIIHTNAGYLGMIAPAGHNDFYCNGGKAMPGCGIDIQCSHTRSTDYMADSIDHQGFMGKGCLSAEEALAGVDNCTGSEQLYMGGSFIKPELGIFALNTNAEIPYYLGNATYLNDEFDTSS